MSDNGKKLAPLLVILLVPLLTVGTMFTLIGIAVFALSCNTSPSAVKIDPSAVPDAPIGAYGHEQLVNAAYVMKAGADAGLSLRDQTIGVMTAMGESGLRNIGYGDYETGGVLNPDGTPTTSIGLFQQQKGWGSTEERLDPYIASQKFFTAMTQKVPNPDRQTIPPTIVAHRTQINSDPYHYERYWDTAQHIVAALSEVSAGQSSNTGSCGTSLVPGEIGPDGWAKPGDGPVNGEYGPRGPIQTPAGIINAIHTGMDLEAGGCNGPIWAAHNGRVSRVFVDSLGNWIITVDHGSGVVTRYVHMYEEGVLVHEGDSVQAAQQIAKTGSSGASTGCHLHFEVMVDGEFLNPRTFLNEVGITY